MKVKFIKRRNLIKIFLFLYFLTPCLLITNKAQADLNKRKNKTGLIYYHGNQDIKKIALTFDDGPSAIYTEQILDILGKYNAKATFFVIGKNVKKHPEVIKKIVQQGHEIGNHSFSHPDMFIKTFGQIYSQLVMTEEAISDAVEYQPRLFRPPYGVDKRAVFKVIKRKGYVIIRWSASGKDWDSNNPQKIAERVINSTKNGTIILLHDGRRTKPKPNCQATVDALPIIIEDLQAKGYEFVTVSELLEHVD